MPETLFLPLFEGLPPLPLLRPLPLHLPRPTPKEDNFQSSSSSISESLDCSIPPASGISPKARSLRALLFLPMAPLSSSFFLSRLLLNSFFRLDGNTGSARNQEQALLPWRL